MWPKPIEGPELHPELVRDRFQFGDALPLRFKLAQLFQERLEFPTAEPSLS